MYRSDVLFLILVFLAGKSLEKPDKLKVCVVGNPKVRTTHTTKYCDLLGKSKRTPVSCVYATDRLECLRAISDHKADFAVFEPEDVYFSTLLHDSSKFLVVSEIRAIKKNPFRFGTVVLVRNSANITGIADLRGKKLCHPGLDSGPDWNPLFEQYFEDRVAPRNCDLGLSVYEDRIKATSEFFGSACKAGPWTVTHPEDDRLKRKYWNLCALCDSGDCRNNEKYRGSGGSITCLKDEVGDVLWARQDDLKTRLKFLEENWSGSTPEYSYLCDDGSQMPITSEDPCLWLAKPWRVIGAHRKSASEVQKIVELLGDDDQNEWEENLIHVVELYLQSIQNVVSKTPEDYLNSIPGYFSASTMSQDNCNPRHSVNLCVSSMVEYEKCNWMSKAASALAILPPLLCVERTNFTSCLKEDGHDAVVVPPDFLHDAITKYNLQPFLMETGNQMNNSYLVSLVVKKKSAAKKIEDLRGKKVCLTRRNGVGWKSVVDILREESLISSECRDHEGLSQFFGEVCVGRMDDGEDIPICCPKADAVGNDEDNALRCLTEGGCDVAAVDYNSLLRITDKNFEKAWSQDLSMSDFRLICRGDKSADCHWIWSYPSYLMTRSEVNTSKMEEIYTLFFQMGQYFGRSSKKNNPMLKIFAPFNKVSNVLFRDTSSSFIPSSHWNTSNDYRKVLERMRTCSGSSSKYTFSLGLLLVCILRTALLLKD